MTRWDSPSSGPGPCLLPVGWPIQNCCQGVWTESLWLRIAWHWLRHSVQAQQKEDRGLRGQAPVAPASLWAEAEAEA